MSHSITITVENTEAYIKQCDDLISDIKDCQKISDLNKFNLNFNKQVKEIENLKNNFQKMVNTRTSSYQWQKDISTFQKESINIKQFVDTIVNKNIVNCLEQNEFNIQSEIINHGSLSIETYDYMIVNNIDINKTNFDKTLSELRHKQINDFKRKNYIEYAFKLIDESILKDNVKFLLKKEIKNVNSIQEMSDVLPMINSKIYEQKNLDELTKKIVKLLKKQNFVIDKTFKLITEIDSHDNIVYKLSMINQHNNSVQLILRSDNTIKYKLGNYEGHMCNKTTEKLLNDLKEFGFNPRIQSVKRDISNSKPLSFEKTMNG